MRLAGGRISGLTSPRWGGINAEPDFVDLWAGVPEGDVLVEVAGLLPVLIDDGPVDVHARVGYVLEDAFVGGGFAADVVILRQTVNGDGNGDEGELGPGGGGWG